MRGCILLQAEIPQLSEEPPKLKIQDEKFNGGVNPVGNCRFE
jgi:hypothetical protein